MTPATSAETTDNNIPEDLKICVIGAGNVATHIAKALSRSKGMRVTQVCARSRESSERLAAMIPGAVAITRLDEISDDADLYLIMANDDAVREIASSTPDYPGIWAHTSGSVPMDVFAGKKSRYGVFYPLQTFSKNVDVDVAEVPMFIEGSSPETEQRLTAIASAISRRVEKADSQRRGALHMAAVFACNFANLMWKEADELLRKEGLDISFMSPLLNVTLGKLKNLSPEEAMTGPARRGDTAVIAKHLNALPPEKRRIYGILSEEIIKAYHPEKLNELAKATGQLSINSETKSSPEKNQNA